MTTWIERTARRKSIGQVALFLVVTAIMVWIFAENASSWKDGFVAEVMKRKREMGR